MLMPLTSEYCGLDRMRVKDSAEWQQQQQLVETLGLTARQCYLMPR
jgi:hypothetical protein